MELIKIKGSVDHIIFRNQENGYTVLVFIPEQPVTDAGLEDESRLTCVGIFPSVSDGEYLELSGEWTFHESFGQQFSMKHYQTYQPKDAQSVKRYLASGAIKGIGESLAQRIIDRFGDNTFRIIEEEPLRLAEVKGISEKKAADIASQLAEKYEQRMVVVELGQYGIQPALAIRIYNQLGAGTLGVIRENPYRLANEVRGVGFYTADEIAEKIGIPRDSDFRIQSGLLFVLRTAATEGNTCLPKERLLEDAAGLLGVMPDLLELGIEALLVEKAIRIVRQKQEESGEVVDLVYDQRMYQAENRSAGMLLALDDQFEMAPDELDASIREIEAEQKMPLDPIQRQAVAMAARQGVFILTGGPGTGKTTTTRAILRFFEKQGLSISLAAPTGRAAKRMGEACGQEARTIHRLLEVSGGEGGGSTFARNSGNPLEADVVIIDEVSMVDAQLFYSLLQAVAVGTRLILVGDENQLPSVGPGNVLKDIIASGAFSVVTLKKIFRQALTSDIIVNAHKINDGQRVEADNHSKDFFLLRRGDADHIIATLRELVTKKIPPYVGCSPEEIQILAPQKKGLTGVLRLNRILQTFLNPPAKGKKERVFGERTFREGDKVMQTKNDYNIEWEIRGKHGIVVENGSGIFNGDMGRVRAIRDIEKCLEIEFDEGRIVKYPFQQIEELEHAYAVTIHKSQGSEYPAVLIPLMPGPRLLYTRNLLYTAITRAKKCVILVGEEKVFYGMIENDTKQQRYSGFADRIREKRGML